MTPAQNRALRSVLLSHLRHLDRFVMYLDTAPGLKIVGTIYDGIRTDVSYQRASVRAAIHQLEDSHAKISPHTNQRRGTSVSEPTGSSDSPSH